MRLPRLTGFTLGPVGLSWEQRDSEERDAQQILNFLEDRRVLFNNYELEIPQHCVDSVIHIRDFLTNMLGSAPVTEEGLPANIRAMRAACSQFLDDIQRHGRTVIIQDSFRGGPDAWTFFTALGEMRALIGIQIAILAKRHGLDVPRDLVKVLPPEPDE